MRRKCILMLCVAVSLTSFSGCSSKSKDAQEEQKVEWLLVSEHYLDEDGNVLMKSGYLNVWEYTYDEHGNLVSASGTDEDGTGEDTYENDYDGDQLVRVSHETYYDSTILSLYSYDANGNCIEQNDYFDGIETDTPSQKIVYTYDSDNRMTSMTIAGNKVSHYKYEYEYDDNGNLIQLNQYCSGLEAETPDAYGIYSYDEENRCTTEKWYHQDGTICRDMLYKYDDPEAACVVEYYEDDELQGLNYCNEDMDILKSVNVGSDGTYATAWETDCSVDENGYKHLVKDLGYDIVEYIYMPFYYDQYAPLNTAENHDY